MSKSCLECFYRRLSRDSPHCEACDASGSGFSFDTHEEQKSLYGYCLQCGTYHVSGEKCSVTYRIEPKLEKPIDAGMLVASGGIMDSDKKEYLYCAKNVLYEWAYGARYCDGPNGDGVEKSCLGCNAYTNEKDLVEAIGNYVLRKMGI